MLFATKWSIFNAMWFRKKKNKKQPITQKGKRVSSPETAAMQTPELLQVIQKIADHAGDLGTEIVDISGRIDLLDEKIQQEADFFNQLRGEMSQLLRQNSNVTESAGHVATLGEETLKGIVASRDTLTHAISNIESLAGVVDSNTEEIKTLNEQLKSVEKITDVIGTINKQTRLLALNATIEAARAGEHGRGFSVVAEEVNALSFKTTEALAQINSTIGALSQQVGRIVDRVEGNAALTGEVISGTDNIRNIISQMDGQVQDIVCATANITHAAHQIDHTARKTSEALDDLADDVATSLKNVSKAHQRTSAIKSWSENMIGMTVVPGVQTNDTVMIELAQQKSKEIALLFETAMAEGHLSEKDLFDRQYTPVEGTSPVQYETAFSSFCDKALPPIQEPALENKRITACVTVDNNGYMPRHMNFRSHPQRPDDPEWNKTNSRYKMMFDDPVGLAAARNTKQFLLQTYRAPLGNNEFALVKDCSAPIYVNGKHWGALRVTYDLKQVIDD